MNAPYTDTTEPTSKRSAAWWFCAAFCMSLVMYPLSLGPAAVLHAHGYLPDAAEHFYEPLEFFCRYTHTMKIAETYIQWWLTATGSG